MHKMMKRSTIGAVGALTLAATFVASPAMADPGAGEFPALAGTGSDTTQYVMNGLSTAINEEGGSILGSWNAFNPTTGATGDLIQTRAGGPLFERPNGSSGGQRALTSSITGTPYAGVDITGQLDFARSSSGPSVAGGELTFIPFGIDAVSYASADTLGSSVPAELSSGDLSGIYEGTVTTYRGSDGQSYDYQPRLPQADSGTREFFLDAIGLSEGDVAWIDEADYVQENDGTDIDEVGEIVPFSVASWIAQGNNVVPNTIAANGVTVGAVDGHEAVVGGSLNAAFPFDRTVFNVVETARLSGTSEADLLLQETFVGSNSLVAQNADVIERYGFGVASDIGSTTATGGYRY